jgi:hypothetical protein
MKQKHVSAGLSCDADDGLAGFDFVRFDDQWYLELAPTFHYTWNGYAVSHYYEDLLNGLKRMQKNNAVFLLVMFWTRVLQNQTNDSEDQAEYPFLRFGELQSFSIPFGVYDDSWMNKEPIEKADKSAPRRRIRRPARGRGRGRR